MYVNKKRICVVAPQRSGHHAIINWVMSNAQDGNAYLLNHIIPGTNPFETYTAPGSRLWDLNIEEELQGKHKLKDIIIYNYEERELKDIFFLDYGNKMNTWMGESEKEFYILNLRDPFNNLASKYKWMVSGLKWAPTFEMIEQSKNIWKSYAREFVGITSFFPESNKIFLNYNKWFSDISYRDSLAKMLLLHTSDKGLEEVAKWGPNTWGDGFDNMKYDGHANKMDVLNRWRNFSEDELFKSLFKDKELLELSEKIFGYIPETEMLC